MAKTQSKTNENKGLNVLEGPLLSKIFAFAIPVMLTNVLQWAYNAADSIVVGKFSGKTALAAVTSNGALINLIIGIIVGLSLGASVLVAQGIGENNPKKIKKIQGTAFLVAILGGFLILIIGVIFAPTFLKWMGSPEDVIGEASLYLRIYFLGSPFNMVYLFGAGMLRAAGDSKRPLIFAMISGAVNVVLNLVLVVVFQLGVIGVGVGTVASMVVSCVLVLNLFRKGVGPLKFTLKDLKFDFRVFRDIISIGIPAGLQALAFSLSNTIVQTSVNSFGSVIIAGNGAASSIDGLQYQFVSAFYQVATTFAGQCVGAKRIDRLGKATRLTSFCTIGMSIVTGVLIYVFGRVFLSIYVSDPDPEVEKEIIEAGFVRLKYVALPYFLCGFQDMMASTLKAMNQALLSMIASLACVCCFRLIWIFTVFKAEKTIESLLIIYVISWVLASTAMLVIYIISKNHLRKKWEAEKRTGAVS